MKSHLARKSEGNRRYSPETGNETKYDIMEAKIKK